MTVNMNCMYICILCILACLIIQPTVANTNQDLPTGKSADIMKRMFGEVRPYSFQKKADVVETKVEKEVVAETNKLKDAVQKVEDNDNVPHNSNSIVPPSTSTTTTSKTTASNVVKQSDNKKEVATSTSSSSSSSSSSKTTSTNKATTPSKKTSLKDAGKVFDSVWATKSKKATPSQKPTATNSNSNNLRGSAKTPSNNNEKQQQVEEKHEADLKRSYDALDKASPETKEALVETSSKLKTGLSAKLDAKEKALKMSENNPFYEKYSSNEKAPKRKPQPQDNEDEEEPEDPSSLLEEQQQMNAGEPLTSSDKDVTMNTAETMSAVAAMNQPVAHPVNSAWNPLNQDHTPQALTYGAVPSANAPHMPANIYPLGSVDSAGSVVPSPTYLAGSHGVVNSQYVRSPDVGTMPQQMNAGLPGYNAGYQAGLAAAGGSSSNTQTALLEQKQQQQPAVNKYNQGYQAGVAAAKYKAGYEAGLHSLQQQQQQQQPAAAAPAPVAAANAQQQQRFVQVPVGTQAKVANAAPQVQQQLQQQPQQVIIKVVQDKPSTATAVKYTPAKVHPQQRLISKASLLSNNGMTNNRQQFQQPQQKNINSNSNRNNLALLDVKSKSKSKVKEPSGVYNGNYLASWPPPQGTQQHLMTPLLGNAVAPAVPPPSPPQIGMAPPPPPASHISNTPDVLPQPTPPTDATDVRYGVKRFPDQSDAGSWAGGASTESKNNGEEGEPLLNEPLQTPFGIEDTQNAHGEMK